MSNKKILQGHNKALESLATIAGIPISKEGLYVWEKFGLKLVSDGKTWVQSNILGLELGCNSVYYTNGIWVAAGGNHGLYYSTDAKTWTRSNVTSGYAYSVYSNGDIWVAGEKGVYYSTDGKTWTQSSITSGSFNSVYYGNGTWVAAGSNGLFYSTDGKSWAFGIVGGSSMYVVCNSVYYGGGLWVAGSDNNGLYYSTDGETWIRSNITSGNFTSIYYADGIWVTSCDNGLYYSVDGKTWTRSNITSGYFTSIYYANGIWVAGSETGLYYSIDGKNWTKSNVGGYSYIKSIYYANNLWVAGGSSETGLYYSTDGKNWTYGNSCGINSFYYASDIWVAAGSNGLYYLEPTKEKGEMLGYIVGDNESDYPDKAVQDGYYYEKVLPPFNPSEISWANGTDAQIAEMVAAADAGKINLSDYWSVGDTRTVQLSAMSATGVDESHNAQTVELVLMHAGGYDLNSAVASGRSKCSFIVGMKNCLATDGYMNSSETNSGSWDGSARRTWCNNVFKAAMPSTLLPIFKQFKTITAETYNGMTLKTSVDWFALPAEKEVSGGPAGHSNPTEFNALFQFDWYKTASNKIKKRGMTGSSNLWWERSPYYDGSGGFCCVHISGTAYVNAASNTFGLTPFGCI